MLANHIAETYSDLSSVDWAEVVVKPEFAGHTRNSLKAIYSNIRISSSRKFNVVSSEVTLRQVVDYSELVYGEGAQGQVIGTYDNKLGRQKMVIAFFESKVEELGIVGFL